MPQQAVPGTPDDHLLDMWDQIPKWAHELEGYPFTFDADKHAGMVSIHLVPPGSHFSGPEVNLLVLEMNLGWNFADQMSGFEEGAANMAHTEARIQNARCIYGPDA